jgi:molybdate transport system substrate-binding protein
MKRPLAEEHMSIEITGVSSMATRLILEELSRRYEASSGDRVAIRPMGGVDAARLVRAGEAVDVVVLASNVMAELEAEGHVAAGSIAAFTRSGMAIAVRAGAPRPDIGSEDAVRRALAAAASVGYSTGPSGNHLLRLYEKWGLSADRLVKAPPGVPVGTLVAQGDAEMGVQQLSELMTVPGIDIVGPLPPDIQKVTVFSAGVGRTAAHVPQARALIAFLISPEAVAVKRANGMEPA